MTNQSLGAHGERLATVFLKRKHFVILECNFRTRYGEIDVIARRGKVIHFVEVKTRSSDQHGQPYEAVRLWKIHHLKRAAYAYLRLKGLYDCALSIDVISILGSPESHDIKHFENITG